LTAKGSIDHAKRTKLKAGLYSLTADDQVPPRQAARRGATGGTSREVGRPVAVIQLYRRCVEPCVGLELLYLIETTRLKRPDPGIANITG
jgi:hypothetical protein